MTYEGEYTKTVVVIKPPPGETPALLDQDLATYAPDGLLAYPQSCFRGTRIAITNTV